MGGSSRQAQDIIQGKKADTVTFNQVPDIEILVKRRLVAKDWASQFPNNASPYYSTIAFIVRKDNPFPTACALVCEHPCEERCRRRLIDAPINIRVIKKYACDNAPADTVPVPKRSVDTGRSVAVIGAGPSGMTCAYFLALMGHRVVVLEARKKLGGMMRYGIPPYRFPRERLDEDLRGILAVGNIEVRTESAVDTELFRSAWP